MQIESVGFFFYATANAAIFKYFRNMTIALETNFSYRKTKTTFSKFELEPETD